MKVLYAAFRHDPRDPDLASGVDHNFYTAMCREGLDVEIVGPFPGPFPLYERAVRRVVHGVSGRRFIKWDMTTMLQAARAVNRAEQRWKPDIVFSIFPPPLMSYRGEAPGVFNTDITFRGMHEGGTPFDPFSLRVMEWVEHRAVCNSARILAFSGWCKGEIMRTHAVPPDRIEVLPQPSALPLEIVPESIDIEHTKCLPSKGEPLRLLVVGRDFHRKGIDIAIEITERLNAQGVAAHLVVCGLEPPAEVGMPRHVRFAGLFRKSVREELRRYADLYRQAHLLLHPARHDASPVVPGEAAAFATPTIANDVQGLGTTVADGESGIVLPGGAPVEAYVEAIIRLVGEPGRYYGLCRSARARYERELNWDAAGRRIVGIFEALIEARRR